MNNKLINLIITLRQVEAWLTIDPEFKDWGAAQSYLKQVQEATAPYLCPTCQDILPESGPCPCSKFVGYIPFQGEPYPPRVYSEWEEYF